MEYTVNNAQPCRTLGMKGR